MRKHEGAVWADRKRNFLGLPWSFTKYSLDEGKLYINSGFFTSTEDEVRLYRIVDVTLRRTLWQKIIRTGTIHCDSADKTLGEFEIKNIKKPYDVKEKLSNFVEEARLKSRVYAREDMHSGHGDDDMDHDFDHGEDHDFDFDEDK